MCRVESMETRMSTAARTNIVIAAVAALVVLHVAVTVIASTSGIVALAAAPGSGSATIVQVVAGLVMLAVAAKSALGIIGLPFVAFMAINSIRGKAAPVAA